MAGTMISPSNGGGDDDDDDVVIVAAVRTPLTKSRKGGLARCTPFELMLAVFRELLARSSPELRSNPSLVDDICVGNVLMPSNGFAAVRMAQLAAGIPPTTSLSLVNRQCASGLQAMANIADAVRSGTIRAGIAAGVESMSQTPMDSIRPPDIGRDDGAWKSPSALPPAALDCLLPMGITSDTVAKRYRLNRGDLDAFALESHRRAARAQRTGAFDAETVAVLGVTKDDGIRAGATFEGLARLRPVFSPNGMTTAGNSSQTTDGAAGVLMMRRSTARQWGMPVVLGTWKGYACVGVPPALMGIGPAAAIPRVLQRLELSPEDVDVYEINEAFASQAHYCVQELKLDPARVNPNGGAIALGHPLGATGVRLAVSLLYELRRRQKQQHPSPPPPPPRNETSRARPTPPPSGLGVVSMCVGTGMGAAAVLRVEPASAL
jgi:acetyl-CoA acyltransferase 1